ncbi:MAG: TonB-dependent receptor [Gammaproteobacteria bacterium]|nr:TonB-dependent receptor [Gammaproteobacteria bacterium]
MLLCFSARLSVGAGFLVLAAILASPAMVVAEEGSGGIEEVIVTAQRTAESIQDVPIAVTALTGEMLEDKQVINPSDLQMNAPSVSFTATNFGNSSFSIRGIGRLVISTSGEAGVSTHLNEIAVNTNLNAIEFFDMERVEILRGPQGTLYGRNATGGAINFVTRMPDFESVNGFVDVEGGDYSHLRFKGAVNVPFSETMGLRLAGFKLDRDGYIDNVAHGQTDSSGNTLAGINDDVDGRDILALRATFAWDITDRASLWVQYNRFDEDDDRARITNQVCVRNSLPTTGCLPNEFGFESPHLGSTTGGIFGGSAGALPAGVDGTDPSLFAFPRPVIDGFRDMHTDYEPVFENEEDLITFGFDYEFDRFNASLLGAYQETDYLSRQDYLMDVGPTLSPTALNPSGLWPTSEPAGRAGDDWRPGPCNLDDGTAGVFGGCVLPVDQTRVFAYDQSDRKGEYWTLEARVQSTFEGRFNFQAGASTYDSESNGDYYVLANTLDLVTVFGSPALAAPPLYPGFFNATGNPSGDTLQDGWAVFGEGYFDITDSVKLTAGLRYNEDNKEVSDSSVLFNAVDINAAIGGVLGPDPVWTRTTGFLLGDPTDVALGNLYAPDLVAAAAATAPLSPERFAVSAAVPIVPQFGETRALTGSPSEEEWSEVSGRIGIDWQINNDSMVYAFFSRGYKPGGFNPPIPPSFQSTSAFTFDSEEVDSIEIGTKNTLLDGTLTLNGTFFVYDYSGLQVTRIVNNSSINDNIDADIMGIEIESLWRPNALPGLEVDFSYGWLDTEVQGSESVDPVNRSGGDPDFILLNNIDPGSATAVNYVARESQITQAVVDSGLANLGALDIRNGGTVESVSYPANSSGVSIPAYFSQSFLAAAGVETSNGIPVSLDGKRLPNSPEHTIKLGLAYTWDIPAISGQLTARWDYYWQDDSYAREFNSVGDEIDSWDQHNATLIYESNDGRWMVKGWIRNIQNEDNVTGKYLTADTSGFFRNYFVTEPRIYGASLRFNFGA